MFLFIDSNEFKHASAHRDKHPPAPRDVTGVSAAAAAAATSTRNTGRPIGPTHLTLCLAAAHTDGETHTMPSIPALDEWVNA